MTEEELKTKADLQDKIVLFFCRLGFAGKMPFMPGTWGTVLACLLAPLLFLPFGLAGRIVILIILFILGSLAADRAEKILGEKDPGQVVIDELVGVWLAMLPFAHPALWLMLAAFILFRFFDIMKPWPIRQSERWFPGGLGVMVDDVLAGFYTMLCLWLIDFINWL